MKNNIRHYALLAMIVVLFCIGQTMEYNELKHSSDLGKMSQLHK